MIKVNKMTFIKLLSEFYMNEFLYKLSLDIYYY